MKRTAIYVLAIACALIAVSGISANAFSASPEDNTENTQLLVEIPVPPQSITRLDERCNYILDHFWDNFNYKSAFSSKKRFDATFGQYLAFTPYATADTVHMTINRMIAAVSKTKADNVLELCKIAEKWTHADTAEYQSDELYLPFVKAVVENKKIKGPEKARYQAQYQVLTSSMVGVQVPDFEFTCPDGSKSTMHSVSAPHILLMFVDPECSDCKLAKTRLDADYIVKSLVDADVLDIVAIYPGDPSDAAWLAEAPGMPEGWIVGASDDVDKYFDIDPMPRIFYLDANHVVKSKNVTVDGILAAFTNLLRIQKNN